MTVIAHMFGLTIECDRPLFEGCRRTGASTSTPDLRIRLGTTPADQSTALPGRQILDFAVEGRRWQTATALPDGGWMLRFWGVCDAFVSPSLQAVDVHLVPDVDVGLVDVLARGAMPAFVLLLSGHGVLHASAVVVDGRGLAIVGRSGMGKSTVAALLCAGQGQLVTDDLLRFGRSHSGVVGYAGTDELRLRRTAGEFAGLGAMRETVDGRRAALPRLWEEETAPIDVVLLPQLRRDTGTLRVQPLQGADALLSLLRFPRLPGLVDPDVHSAQLSRLAALAGDVPVLLADIPWRDGPSPGLGAAIRQAVNDVVEGLSVPA